MWYRNVFMGMLALVLPSVVTVGEQPPPIAWTHQFDFNSGTQGWELIGNATEWVNPATDPSGPLLPDGAASGAGAGNLYLPDYCRARLPLTAVGRTHIDKFVMQADIFIPNLRPLGLCNGLTCYGVECCGCGSQFAFCHYPGNINDRAGISARGSKSLSLIGDLGNCRQVLWDHSVSLPSINDRPGPTWLCEQYEDACHTRPVPPYNDFPVEICWWNQWITVYLDYNWSSPGRIVAWARVPWTGGRHDPRYEPNWPWHRLLGSDWTGVADPNGPRLFTELMLGWPTDTDRGSWTQCQYDNVRLALGPSISQPEVCDNAIDDDLDGLTDCEDPQCDFTTSCPCPNPFADGDRDGDVDQDDFGLMQLCMHARTETVTGCDCWDASHDLAVDAADVSRFLQCFRGPYVAADRACDN